MSETYRMSKKSCSLPCQVRKLLGHSELNNISGINRFKNEYMLLKQIPLAPRVVCSHYCGNEILA